MCAFFAQAVHENKVLVMSQKKIQKMAQDTKLSEVIYTTDICMQYLHVSSATNHMCLRKFHLKIMIKLCPVFVCNIVCDTQLCCRKGSSI